MGVAIGQRADAADLASIIDKSCFVQSKFGGSGYKRVQIKDLALFPKDCMFDRVRACGKKRSVVKTRSAHNLAFGINRIRRATGIPVQRSQACHCTLLPRKREKCFVERNRGGSHTLS